MDKMLVVTVKELIKKTSENYEFECDVYEKSGVLALAIQKLAGGEIRCFDDDFGEALYYNEIDGEYYNLLLNDMPMKHEYSKLVLREELLENNRIAYVYYKFIIYLMRNYMDIYKEQNSPIKDYLELRSLIPFFERLHRETIISLNSDRDGCITMISDTNKLMHSMEKKYDNIKLYLYLENELNKSETDFKNFKNKVLSKKK